MGVVIARLEWASNTACSLFVGVHVWYSKGKGGGAVYAVQRGRYCMDINHQEEHGPGVSAADGWGVSTVMSP